MAEGEEPTLATPAANGGPPSAGAPGTPAGPAPPQGLAMAALVAAVISLAVPVVPAIVALVLAAAAARSRRNLPAGAPSGRRLVSAACVLSLIGLVVWAGLAASILAVPTQPEEPMTLQAPAAALTTTSEPTVPTPTAPASGPTGDKGWLAAITELHRRLEEPFTVGFVFTQAKTESLAELFRGCRRELARIGAPSDRLQPAYQLVRQACAQYDKAAHCFATAADYLTVELSLDPDGERSLNQAIQCGAAAQEEGTKLLAEAEALSSELHDPPG
jgi:hypothetical protein